MKRQQDIQRILEDFKFKGVRNIPGIKSAKKKVLITKIKNERGEITTSRQGIDNVFGEFYKKNHDDNEIGENGNESSTDVRNNDTDEMTRIPEITTEELQTKGKSPDSNGIRAKDIKACDDETKEMANQTFNEIIKQNEFTPEAWKKVKIKLIHKKGDVENVGNYRPICSLPALYKLFSTILYRRYRTKSRNATSGQSKCGQRRSTSRRHLTPLHKSIWKALKSCGIKHDYIGLLKKIYRDQKASVHTDEESNMFEIKKGTKLGDPLSSLLFNTVVHNSLNDDIQRLQKRKGMGIYLSDHDHDCLTNLRFADDVLLFATSMNSFKKCCAISRKVLKKCVSGSTQKRRKFSKIKAA